MPSKLFSGDCSDHEGCPRVDQEPSADDDVVELAAGTLLSFESGEAQAVRALHGGSVVFSPAAFGCVPDLAPCRMTLKRLAFELGDFDLSLSDGTTAHLESVVTAARLPLDLEDDGGGYRLPAGTAFQTCGSVDGNAQHALSVTSEAITLAVDDIGQTLSISGSFVFAAHENNRSCSQFEITISGQIDGVSPWQQRVMP